ncbi:npp1 domain-containing protein [Thozetella sp. PMI_491]|nr:npp1 domain-containing protein [Thozetella sp. PMI_491]
MAVLSRVMQGSVALLAATSASASPIERRAVINHTDVLGFPEAVPGGSLGAVYEAYKPFLKVVNGCVPFPAVDADGNTSGGLKPTGGSSDDCSSSPGQIYARAGTYNGRYGVMYSWYFPKDEPSSGLGHRHDWEGVVVWLASPDLTSVDNILAVCPSSNGDWSCSTADYPLSGTSPLIQYKSNWPSQHGLEATSTIGGQQPLVAWESLPSPARDSLSTTSFEDVSVPFIDANLETNLAKATF